MILLTKKEKMYHNTTNETQENVNNYKKITAKQDKRVLSIIRNQNKPFSASVIYKIYLHKHVIDGIIITSVRRSINTLKRYGYLTETGNRVKGMYGRSELEYSYVK